MKPIGNKIIPQAGDSYIHAELGTRYTVLGIGMVKIPKLGWTKSVLYTREDGSSDTTYTRTLDDFQSHFADADGIIDI